MTKDSRPYKLYILIDTNIYYSDPLLIGAQFGALKKMVEKTNSKLIVPRIVEMEVEKKYAERINIDFAYVERTLSKYPESLKIKKTRDDLLNEFKDNWRRFTRRDRNIIITEHNSVDVEALVKRSIQERAPFGKKSKGFRDAVIWESSLSFLRSREDVDAFVVITKNTEDFGKDGLAPELAREISDIGRNVYYYQDIGSFLKEHGDQIAFLSDELVNEWVEGESSYLESIASEEDRFDDRIDRYHLDQRDPEDIKLIETELDDYRVYSYYVYDEDVNNFYVEVEVELDVYGYVEYNTHTDPWESEEWGVPTWQRRTEHVSLSTSVELQFKVDKKTKEAEPI